MKSKFYRLSIFIFLISLFFLSPIKAECKSYISEFTKLGNSSLFNAEEFAINLDYITYDDNSTALSGYANKKIDTTYYYHYVVRFYDLNREKIGETDGYNGIWSDSLENGSYISIKIDNKNMFEGHDIGEIVYYKLFVEPADKEVAHNYIYNEIKLNPDGIDPITDDVTYEFNVDSKENEKQETLEIYQNYDYVLNKYDINISVNENNTFFIKESIGTTFNISKHGIFRKIPLKNSVIRLDGSKSSNRVKITNITVDDQFSKYNENGYLVLKIGDPNKTLTGNKDYVISYLYNIGKDPSKDFDELYFNIIGNEWDTVIDNVTFTIKMPKEFDASKLGFSYGEKGSTQNEGIKYEVNGNIIKGSLNTHLMPGEGLTVRLELPEGYFVNASSNFDFYMLCGLVLPIIFLVISFFLWKKFGKDDQVVETVEFYPPQGFNSAEVGFLYHGAATSEGVVSLLIYLANKGYLKINEIESQGIFGKNKTFQIEKIKEYDGLNEDEKTFFEGLFKPPFSLFGKQPENKTVVTETDLTNNFYVTTNKIITNINRKENRDKIFEKSSTNKNLFITLMVIISLAFITIKPVYEYSGAEMIFMALLFPGMAALLLASAFSGHGLEVNGKKTTGILSIILSIVMFALIGVLPWIFMVYPALMLDQLYLIIYIIGYICIVGICFFGCIMSKRTPYGIQMLGKLRGFRNFLITAEKDKLESLVTTDPSYFYNILPYTYVLGVSQKWIEKFESIAIQPPSWYNGSSAFNMHSFGTFMNSTLNSAQSSMTSSPSSSSSGGGSSGGGSGGGGGGSW